MIGYNADREVVPKVEEPLPDPQADPVPVSTPPEKLAQPLCPVTVKLDETVRLLPVPVPKKKFAKYGVVVAESFEIPDVEVATINPP